MSVINTNYLALVSQNNLTRSQSALGTAIERLSSGMRINSAKDDAAGQAIANRFTANIKGLTQASRNANDGISIAQTTEGSLNEINNNLQRIRELSVQAANGSNSNSDLDSIQAEIKERLDEIDRVSRETQFNGKYVLGGDAESLSVQVGAHDNQRINIELSRIDSSTLNLSSYNVNGAQITAVNTVGAGGTGTQTQALAAGGNSIDPSNQPINSGVATDGKIYEITGGAHSGGYAVKTTDDTYHVVTENTATGKWVWDSADSALDVASTDIGNEVEAASVYSNFNSLTSADWVDGTTQAAGAEVTYTNTANTITGQTDIDLGALDSAASFAAIHYDHASGQYYAEVTGSGNVGENGFYEITIGNDGVIAPITLGTTPDVDVGTGLPATATTVTTAHSVNIDFSEGLFARNDTPAFVPDASGDGGTQLFAAKGHDGNYYEVKAIFTYNSGDKTDAASYSIEFEIDASSNAVQVSGQNIVAGAIDGTAGNQLTVSEAGLFDPETDLYNLDLSSLPTAAGVYALADGSGYAVQDNNGDYYAGTAGPDGTVAWDSSTAKLDATMVDVAGGPVASGTVQVTGNVTGLAAGQQLVSYTDSEGNTAYAVQSGTGNDAVFTKVTLGDADATTGDRAIVVAAEPETLTIRSDSPLAALDSALQQVDNLRSHLGAIQNRFESTIANLNNTVNNLSAARSRIEDADYAVEVSNMTRAQILQQAGTSVLAQANQIPQTVLSLLR